MSGGSSTSTKYSEQFHIDDDAGSSHAIEKKAIGHKLKAAKDEEKYDRWLALA